MQSSTRRLQKTLQSLRIFLIPVLSLSLLGATCHQQIPRWDGKIWAGDSASSSIQRKQAGEAIACSDGAFDGYLCISGPDFQKFYETYVLGCAKWRDGLPMMTAQEAFEVLKSSTR